MPSIVLPSASRKGNRLAKLGSEKRPLVLRVQNADRSQDVAEKCVEIGAQYILGIEPDKPEDISDIEKYLETSTVQRAQPKVDRNDPCPCGSGKKYKKCCG